jgi:hypothetical protein
VSTKQRRLEKEEIFATFTRNFKKLEIRTQAINIKHKVQEMEKIRKN